VDKCDISINTTYSEIRDLEKIWFNEEDGDVNNFERHKAGQTAPWFLLLRRTHPACAALVTQTRA